MKEITTVITAEITTISKCEDKNIDFILERKEDYANFVKENLNKKFKADDVNVKVQFFVMEQC